MEKTRIKCKRPSESVSLLLKIPPQTFKFVVLACLQSLIVSACANHPCREPRAPELDATAAPATPGSTKVADISQSNITARSDSASANDVILVRVYKPDGSRQCEKRAGISLEVMERELAGIVVHNRQKRSDGLMHIQVCGSPSGLINLYEIDSGFLKQAEQRGFKRWED